MIERADFRLFLEELGITQTQMDAAAALMPEPIGAAESYCVKPSPIHGLGCFATRDIGGLIGTLRDGFSWHAAGRFINHSPSPNARAAMQGNTLVAHGDIPTGEEITLDYRDVRRCIMEDTNG